MSNSLDYEFCVLNKKIQEVAQEFLCKLSYNEHELNDDKNN